MSFSLKNHLSFGLRFPTLRKRSKMGSLDMSQNQNRISGRFFKPELKPNIFLLNRAPEPGGAPNLGAHAHGDAMLLVKQEGRTLSRTPVQSPVSLAHLEHSQVSPGIYRLSLRNPLCTANPWLKF